ncbi:MAG: signal peptidase I [Lachnospiraceae bacterium]|nr:signal peptidase I [Lachnospiraceae bacterium]
MIASVFLILHFVGQRVSVDGPSMMNTLHNGDQLIVDKFTYNFLHEPERFDIVVFEVDAKTQTYFIKRIIGLPGETVQIKTETQFDGGIISRQSYIYINGEKIEYPYPKDDLFNAGVASVPIKLGSDEYFVMGDNVNDSNDSRIKVGNVKRDDIIGRAVLRFWPLADFTTFPKE